MSKQFTIIKEFTYDILDAINSAVLSPNIIKLLKYTGSRVTIRTDLINYLSDWNFLDATHTVVFKNSTNHQIHYDTVCGLTIIMNQLVILYSSQEGHIYRGYYSDLVNQQNMCDSSEVKAPNPTNLYVVLSSTPYKICSLAQL